MAISINGNGTITGISAGGLPAGTVTSATLATGVGGKVLQFKSENAFATASQSTNSSSFGAIANMPTLVITPTVVTSVIFITVTSTIMASQNDRGVQVTLFKKVGSGSYADVRTDGDNGGLIGHKGRGGSSNNGDINPFALTFEDDHNTTSELSYKLYWRTTNADSDSRFGYAAGGANCQTTISAFEIAA